MALVALAIVALGWPASVPAQAACDDPSDADAVEAALRAYTDELGFAIEWRRTH